MTLWCKWLVWQEPPAREPSRNTRGAFRLTSSSDKSQSFTRTSSRIRRTDNPSGSLLTSQRSHPALLLLALPRITYPLPHLSYPPCRALQYP